MATTDVPQADRIPSFNLAVDDIFSEKEQQDREKWKSEFDDLQNNFLDNPKKRKNFILGGVLFLVIALGVFGSAANNFEIFACLGFVFPGESPALIDFYEMLFLESLAIGLVIMSYYLVNVLPLRSDEARCDMLSGRLHALNSRDENYRKMHLLEMQQATNLEISKFYFPEKIFVEFQDGLLKITEHIENKEWNKAEYQIKFLNTKIDRYERGVRNDRIYQNLTWITAVGYSALLILAVWMHGAFNLTFVPAFRIPYSILIWGAAGSIAAILYQLYKEDEEEFSSASLTQKKRWLAARPAIGIIMSGVTYLALYAGLDLLGGTPTISAADLEEIGVMAPFWIIAFLAGFTDRFYESVINSMLSKFATSSEGDTDESARNTSENPNPGSQGA